MTVPAVSDISVTLLDAIYHRRSVRDYKPDAIDKDTIRSLIDAATHAPSSMNEQPWSFVVVQDQTLLNRLSDSAKELVRAEMEASGTPQAKHALDLVNRPNFHVFYNANTLILICNKMRTAASKGDCWLAAENLMLAARAHGLGTCVIGFAIAALNLAGWKTELKIPFDTTVEVPIILGIPASEPPPVTRKPPEILSWR
jgi:nitroreductase